MGHNPNDYVKITNGETTTVCTYKAFQSIFYAKGYDIEGVEKKAPHEARTPEPTVTKADRVVSARDIAKDMQIVDESETEKNIDVSEESQEETGDNGEDETKEPTTGGTPLPEDVPNRDILIENEVDTVEQLIMMTDKELIGLPDIAKGRLAQIRAWIDEINSNDNDEDNE